MAWNPISGTVPQYHVDGAPATDYYLKGYTVGTTTPLSMATDSTGGTPLAKCKINSAGYPVNGSNAVFIPHFNADYKLALYTNSIDADANTTANATWIVDSIGLPDSGLRAALADDSVGSTGGYQLVAIPKLSTESNVTRSYRDYVDPARYGIVPDTGVDLTALWNNMIASIPVGKEIRFKDGGTYLGNFKVRDHDIEGTGRQTILKSYTSNGYALTLGGRANTQNRCHLFNLEVLGDDASRNGIRYGDGTGTAATEAYGGKWFMQKVYVVSCDKGLAKPYGNIDNGYLECVFYGNNFDIHASGCASPVMHTGAETWTRCEFVRNKKASAYFNDAIIAAGQLTFDNCLWQNNYGFSWFIQQFSDGTQQSPILLINPWFENWGDMGKDPLGISGGTNNAVVIDGTSYYRNNATNTLLELHINACPMFIIEKGGIPLGISATNGSFVHLKGTRVDSDNGSLNAKWYRDASSVIKYDAPITGGSINGAVLNDGGSTKSSIILVDKLSYATETLSNSNQSTFVATGMPRMAVTHNNASNLILSESYCTKNASGYTIASCTLASVADGLTFDRCLEVQIPNTVDAAFTEISSLSIPASKWIFWSMELKRTSSADLVNGILISGTNGTIANVDNVTVQNEWVTVYGFAKSGSSFTANTTFRNNGGSGTVTYRIGACQFLGFSDRQEAQKYLESYQFTASNSNLPRVVWATAMPNNGSWTAGDRVNIIAPTEAGGGGSKYAITGYYRATTGSNNVLNTDWFEMRTLTGN